MLLEHTILRFQHWMDAEVSQSHPGYCYDGGMVEISVNGGAWAQISPVGGYPYRIREGSIAGPWPAETEVYSGSIDWSEAVFEIAGGSGEARFRFRFGSDGAEAQEGWYIDDVEIFGYGELPSLVGEPTTFALAPTISAARPNPFGDHAEITYLLPEPADVSLRIFDLAGRLVRDLVHEQRDAGAHTCPWDGFGDSGEAVGAGVYFCRLEAGGQRAELKIVVVR